MKNKGGLEIFQQRMRKEVTEMGRKGGASEGQKDGLLEAKVEGMR